MTPQKHTLLGLLFLGAVGILSYYTLFKTDFSFFEEKQAMTVYAEDARNLKKGATVLYAGVRWGKVTSVVPDIDKPREERVRIDLELNEPIRLFTDHEVKIEPSSVLGGVQLGIDPGNAGSGEIQIVAGQSLRAKAAPDVLGLVGDIFQENRVPLSEAIANIRDVTAALKGTEGTIGRLLNDPDTADAVANAVDSIQGTFDNFQALTEELRGGQGTIGKLIYDTKLYDDIETFVKGLDEFTTDARGLLKDAKEGEGIFASIIYDKEITDNLKATVESVRSAAEKIDNGNGTIARLLNDGKIADDIEGLIATFNNPNGTIAKLINDPELYETVQRILGDVADATAALREQRGVLGALVYDRQARDQILQAINVLTGGLEEQREAAPIATFLSTVFIGF